MSATKEQILRLSTKLGLALAMFCAVTPSYAKETSVSEQNKDYAIRFYTRVMNEKDVDGAIAMMGSTYIQHNPTIPDGKEGFKKFFEGFKATYPKAHADIKSAIADGDLVALHTLFTLDPSMPASAVVDIFRFDHGKIVEHWDVIQQIPDSAVHKNTMF